MCCSRARSDGGILHLGRSKDLITEVSAQVLRRAKVHRSADDSLDLELHARQSKESGCLLGLEFDQNIDITFGPKPVRQHGSEERKTPNVVSPAELCDKFTIELDVGGHRRAL